VGGATALGGMNADDAERRGAPTNTARRLRDHQRALVAALRPPRLLQFVSWARRCRVPVALSMPAAKLRRGRLRGVDPEPDSPRVTSTVPRRIGQASHQSLPGGQPGFRVRFHPPPYLCRRSNLQTATIGTPAGRRPHAAFSARGPWSSDTGCGRAGA